MKKLINQIVFGNDTKFSGMIALSVVMLIGLGCFCNKEKFDFGNVASNSSNSSNSSTPITISPSDAPAPTYKKADASKSEIPSDQEMQDIVKKTLLDFNAALQKEDFTDFHAGISKFWQKQTTPENMKISFQGFIDGEADLSPIRSLSAKFTSEPEITRSLGVKTLEVKGDYPTPTIPTTFDLNYIAENKEWKLAGIKVYTKVMKK